MSDVFAVVPEAKRDTVERALQDTFARRPDAPLVPVLGGASGALAYRAVVDGRPYLIRVETRTAWRNPVQDAAMAAAAAAGIAPPLRHADPAAGIAIMDFIVGRPLAEFPGGPAALARAAGALIARLQADARFPELARYPDVLQRLLDNAVDNRMFADGLLDPHRDGLERICAAYPWDDGARVAGHNDPNPRNFLFDGARLWLVDWETAYRNEPLVDVAILTHEIAPTPELEAALLEGWGGRPTDPVLRARVAVMRHLTRLYYAVLILSGVAAAPRAAPETSLAAPGPDEFRTEVMSGRLPLGSPAMVFTLAKMHLAAFRAGLDDPETTAALAAIGG